MTCPHTDAIGVYVLGALDADERIELERHIRDCPSCREAVQQFAHVPGVLESLTLEDVLELRLDDDADSQPASIRRRRRTPKRALLAAAAVVVLLVSGGLIGRQISDGPAPSPQAGGGITWSATDGVGGIDTRVQLSGRSWGTDIQVHMDDLAPGQRCMLVVHTRNGQSEVTGWWTTTTILEADVPASSSFALSDIARVDVVTADNAVLASLTASTR